MRTFSIWMATALACAAMACGSEKDTKSSDRGGATTRINGMTFADDASLPACDASTEAYLVYVTSTSTFKTCSDGAWADIDVKGPKGDKGDAATSEAVQAIEAYKTYRRSVFRATLECAAIDPLPNGCSPATNGKYLSLGSAFLCGPTEVCTNGHVAGCNLTCSTFTSLSFQALGTTDSLNSGTAPTAPFVTVTNDADIAFAGGKVDLAKVKVTDVPSGITPMPLTTEAAANAITAMKSILSLSFPLGLLDLYVDMGAVNTTFIGECNGQSGYDCPKDYYDFSTTNDTDHGSSGSPLIDVANGKVVGVTSAGTEGENANYTWAIDASKFGGF